MRDIKEKKAQTAIEYMLLLATVVAIVLLGFNKYFPLFHKASDIYFNRAGDGIYGKPPRCGDGSCESSPFESCEKCPTDCGTC